MTDATGPRPRPTTEGDAAGDGRSRERELTELFGRNVFSDAEMKKRLPASSYAMIQESIATGDPLGLDVAGVVATAMKEWAIARGASHFTHWFQPLTGLTAEKHDSFLQFMDDRPVIEFSGKQLVQGEPDASSFPSGGIRATSEARGYTAWDPSSPAFIREGTNGATLCIPTIFISYLGEALDKKTPLLRSCAALSREAVNLLRIMGDEEVQAVHPTVGPEQEYFLIDRRFFEERPDLVATGRTLVGARPPKGQELEDHYFGTIDARALAFMEDVERELWQLGVPVKTRHNEVAPSQFEIAPIFERSAVATDHNMLTMDVLRKVATRHGLVCLLHEKPFAGVNGSGKHNNWSMATDRGENLFDPSDDPASNQRFLVFLAAVVRGIDLHADLMRISIANPGNDHRLGANEAPPAIISIYVGDELEQVVDRLTGEASTETVADGTRTMRLGASSVPHFRRDTSDRNRTSPFAFTGNKWEFRAAGASQSVATPNIMINAIVADSLSFMADEIESRVSAGRALPEAIDEVVRETLKKHRRVIFNGDNYSEEWVQQAESLGLPNLRTTIDALEHYASVKNVTLFSSLQVLSEAELRARSNIAHESYAKAIAIEAQASLALMTGSILPASLQHQQKMAGSIAAMEGINADVDLTPQRKLVAKLGRGINELIATTATLQEAADAAESFDGSIEEHARHYRDLVIPAMNAARAAADSLETMVDDDLWKLPKYWQMLFLR